MFDTKSKAWILICDDTSQVNGPSLVFDHQMCIDIAKRNIYVFGGRILTPRKLDDLSNESQYSGLYSFNIGNSTWTQILVDCDHPTASNPEVLSIKSRVTHSMLFHHVSVHLGGPIRIPRTQKRTFCSGTATSKAVHLWRPAEQGIRDRVHLLRRRYSDGGRSQLRQHETGQKQRTAIGFHATRNNRL